MPMHAGRHPPRPLVTRAAALAPLSPALPWAAAPARTPTPDHRALAALAAPQDVDTRTAPGPERAALASLLPSSPPPDSCSPHTLASRVGQVASKDAVGGRKRQLGPAIAFTSARHGCGAPAGCPSA
jgi:hypothetical protein